MKKKVFSSNLHNHIPTLTVKIYVEHSVLPVIHADKYYYNLENN